LSGEDEDGTWWSFTNFRRGTFWASQTCEGKAKFNLSLARSPAPNK